MNSITRGLLWWIVGMLLCIAIFAISTGLGLIAFPSAAHAHQAAAGWTYPLSCCSNYDCKEVGAGTVRERPEGFVIETGEVIPYGDKRIRHSPDGLFHWCAHQAGDDMGKTICLFVPPRSF
jgi:hypothetical protein